MVYLIHFSRNLHHARHYIGYVKCDLEGRINAHRKSIGAKILAACNAEGIDYYLVRIWENEGRKFERKLKNRKKSSQLCPVCKYVRRRARIT